MLTERRIKSLPPGLHPAGDCLYIRVGKTRHTWIYRTQVGGRSGWITLGHYPALDLFAARSAAKSQRNARQGFTVLAAYKDFKQLIERTVGNPEYVLGCFHRDVLPVIGHMQLARVKRADVLSVLNRILARGKGVTANRTLMHMKRFFSICVEKGWITENPAAGLSQRVAGGQELHRTRYLGVDELKTYIGILLSDRFALKTRLGLALVLLTIQRSSEVLGVDRKEIHGVWWTIPAARMKKVRGQAGRDQKVYLSPQAQLLLKLAFRHFGPRPFAGMRHITLSQATKRMKFTPTFTPHDSRRTAVTFLGDNYGLVPHVAERMLHHLLPGMVPVYNHAAFLNEVRAAWRIWGRVLAHLRREVRRENRTAAMAVGGHRVGAGTYSPRSVGHL